MKSGIYKISNTKNGNCYIGSSQNIGARWSAHRGMLRKGCHHSVKLQRAWDKHGEESFLWEILELSSPGDLVHREQSWMDSSKPFYNILMFAHSTRGFVPSDEARAKMRVAKLGGTRSEEAKRKTSLALTGRRLSEAHVASTRGRVLSEVSRQKVAAARTGRKASPETLEKMRASRLGVKVSKETLAKRKETNERKTREDWTKSRETAVATHAKSYTITSPDDTEHRVFNVSAFSRENGLGNGSGLARVATGARKQYKGWRCTFQAATQ